VNRKNDGKTGLRCICSRDDYAKEYGFNLEAEDPRLVDVNGKLYIVFTCLSPYEGQYRGIGISAFDEWNPIFLQVENIPKNEDRNWAPFVKGGELFFIYNYDPLVIISYDMNLDGICKFIFIQEDCTLPINKSRSYLSGGSNLIHYKNGYYIGGCCSSINKDWFERYTQIVLLDTTIWKIVYVSKPVMYLCDELKDKLFDSWWLSAQSVKALDMNYNILTDKTPNVIQDPISFYLKNDRYYITVNVRDSISLLYEISFANLFDFIHKR
jgi:hypothetical protein